jgi:23S rRNA pseudouridine2605 synthase
MERLQKVLAHSGIASRRKCEELILAGRVRVNDKVVSELGLKVSPEVDQIKVDGVPVRAESKTYIALHKPRGFLSDAELPADSIQAASGQRLAVELVPIDERLYAAGRLDLNSEGLLLLTNDGDLAHLITHPRFEHEKEYLALIEGEIEEFELNKLRKGVLYDNSVLRADHVERASRHQRFGTAERGRTWIRIVLHEGKKRQIRHMGAAIGHPVMRLIRTRIGPIELDALPVGEWRALTEREVSALKTNTRIKKENEIGSFHHRD